MQHLKSIFMTVALLVAFFCAAGCIKAGGVIAYKVMGPPKVPALYDPPKEPLLVMVERYNAPASTSMDCQTIAREIYRDLVVHDVGQPIDPVLMFDLESSNSEKFKKMTISQIGAAVTAKQVIYVRLTSHNVNSVDGGSMISGNATAMVKVIDVATGELRWPTESAAGYPVKAEIPMQVARRGMTPELVNASLTRQIATAVGKLFYAWQPEDGAPRDAVE